jgi:hypothetical protein
MLVRDMTRCCSYLLISFSGISYAVRRSLLSPLGDHQFYNGPGEDFRLLHDLHSCTQDIVVIGSIGYYVRGWRAPDFEPIPSTIISGVNSCHSTQILERYSPPFDIEFRFPEKFQTLHNGLQEALIRTSKSPCIDPIFFRKWFKVTTCH